jgi:hypothetical protein
MSTAVAEISAAAVAPAYVVIRSRDLTASLNQVTAAYQGFLSRTNRSCQNAIRNLGQGGDPAALLSSVKTYAGLQTGTLKTQLATAVRGIPGATMAVLPTLNARADALNASLQAAPDLATFCGPNTSPLILASFQASRADVIAYVKAATQAGTFGVL